ncbi:MAG: hypothetical protein ACQERN_05005 [Thermodesulfobacteriota bacterium]
MHTIVVVSENAQVDNSLVKQLEMLFPDCRIKILHKTPQHSDRIDGQAAWASKRPQNNSNG